MSEFIIMLKVFAASLAMVALLIGAYVVVVRALERHQKRRKTEAFRLLHQDEWDFVVDGKEIASLKPVASVEDLNTSFLVFSVTINKGQEEMAGLLFGSNYRDPDDDRASYRSRTRPGVFLKDSQVYVGDCGEGCVRMKAYPLTAEASC